MKGKEVQMSFWDKIRTGLEEGLETLSEKSAEWSKLAKLKWERRSLQRHCGRDRGQRQKHPVFQKSAAGPL